MRKSNHVQEYVKADVEELVTQAIDSTDGDISAIYTTTVKLVGDVTSASVMFGDIDNTSNSDINISAEVIPSGHKHSIGTINITHNSEANKIVRRDNSGNIYSSGSSVSNTGYKLSDGKDISALFQISGITSIDPVNEDTNSSSGNNVITGLHLLKSGSQLKLYRTYGWVCNCNSHPYCNCCC